MGFFSPSRKKQPAEEARGSDGDGGDPAPAASDPASAVTTGAPRPALRVSPDRRAGPPPVVAPTNITSCITADDDGAWRFQPCTVVVHNPGAAPVLFKVKALHPDEVFVKPNQGAIAAGDDIELTLTFKHPESIAETSAPRPNELAVLSLACDAGHSLPCNPAVEQPPGVFVSRAFDAADNTSNAFPARKVAVNFDVAVAKAVRLACEAAAKEAEGRAAAREAREARARAKGEAARSARLGEWTAARARGQAARRFGCVWRALARTRALARQGYYSEDLASEVRAMEARFESGLAAARAENDGLRTNLEISRGAAAREEAECRRLEAEIDELGLELEHTRAEADRARAEANAHEEAAASASAAAGVAADRLLSAEKSREEKRDRIVEMVKAEAEGKIARETTRMAAEHARRRKLFDDVVANLTGRCEASDREQHDAAAKLELTRSELADARRRLDELHRAVPNVLANVHRRWKLDGRDGTRMARVVFATWRHVAVIARESERLNRCVEELVRERADRDALVREAARVARLDAETRLDARLVRLESANHALTTDLRDARDAAKLARGEVARLARLRETDSADHAMAMRAESDAIAAREEAKADAVRRRALRNLSSRVRSPGALQGPRTTGGGGDGARTEDASTGSSDDDVEGGSSRLDAVSGENLRRASPAMVSSPGSPPPPSRRASSRDPHVLLSRAKSAARASSRASAGWGGWRNDGDGATPPPSPAGCAAATRRAERGDASRANAGVDGYLALARAAARRFNEPPVSPLQPA